MIKFDIHEVVKYIPHRYPFLLVDRVLEVKVRESLLALKNVTVNEPFFSGHFPERPVMPGVLIIEALAQASGILTMVTRDAKPDGTYLFYLAQIENARFKRVVEPGDQLLLNVKVLKEKRGIWKFQAEATVDNEIACSVELTNVRKDI